MSKLIGADALIKELSKYGDDVNKFVKAETEAAGRDIEVDAKNNAPVDLGKLRQSITYTAEDNGFSAVIYTNVIYAAYQEFGTGGFVVVPDEMRELAEFYKGAGVRKVNLKPQPYLYPSLVLNRAKYEKILEQKLDQLTDQFNS